MPTPTFFKLGGSENFFRGSEKKLGGSEKIFGGSELGRGPLRFSRKEAGRPTVVAMWRYGDRQNCLIERRTAVKASFCKKK